MMFTRTQHQVIGAIRLNNLALACSSGMVGHSQFKLQSFAAFPFMSLNKRVVGLYPTIKLPRFPVMQGVRSFSGNESKNDDGASDPIIEQAAGNS